MNYLKLQQLLIFGFTLLIAALPQLVQAQITDTTGTANGLRGAPRVYKMDARSTAMGNATIADPTNIASINLNPAALSFVRDFWTIQITGFQNWENNLMFENATFPVFAFDQHRVAAQVGIHHMGFDAVNPIGGANVPEPDINMYQMDLAYAFSFENLFSIGVLGNFSLTKNEDAQYWTGHATLGVLYAPSQSVSYGMAFRGLGRSPVYQQIGDGTTILGSQNLRESLELGASLQFPTVSEPFLSISFANEKRFGENGIWYKVGAEYTIENIVALRSGLIMHPENEIFAPRFGIGFITDVLKVEYALSYHQELLERYHQIGILINLN